MNLTDKITAGDTLTFATAAPDYPASAGWVLAYRLVPRTVGAQPIRIDSVADQASPDMHRITAGTSVTALWVAGSYSYSIAAIRAGERYTLSAGVVEVLPNPATATFLDSRSTARRALDAITAYLSEPNNLTASRYQIAGRTLERMPLPELWRHRDRLMIEVQKEAEAARVAAGLPDNRRIYVRMKGY